MIKNCFRFVALALTFATPQANAAIVKTGHVEAELIARRTAVTPGEPIEAALRLKIADHWHTYWQNPGDSGLPTKIQWTLPEGFSAGPIQWPHPKKLPLGPLMNFGYEGEVLHLVEIATPKTFSGKQVTIRAKADWLVCSDVCIPESADLSLVLPVSNVRSQDSAWAAAFGIARAALPQAAKGAAIFSRIEGGKLIVSGTGVSPAEGAVSFFPYRDDVIANAGAQTLSRQADGFSLSIPLADPAPKELSTVEGVLVADGGWPMTQTKAVAISAPIKGVVPLSPSTAPTPDSSLTLLPALLLAFVGGLILNLMPCVFPILGIKVLGFVRHAGADASLLRRQGLAFLAGVVISFWVLAGLLISLRTAGQAVGWGFQLQSPAFVTMLAILFLLMALNLSGVFEMGLRLQSAAGNMAMNSQRGAQRDAFLSGVLATIVATPCTAPFMGAALGYTLAQPAMIALIVFTAIALGMALPVTLLSFFPRWLSYLPRPGAWMETFKQFMAFPLLATVAWLAWVLGSQTGNDGVARLLFGLVVVSLAAWSYGRLQGAAPLRALALGTVIALAGIAFAWPDAASTRTAVAAESEWLPYSKQKIEELRAQGKGVFVDFTATWCITCQVNKRVALNRPEVIRQFAESGVMRMKADWTVQDPVITAALAEFGRNGVPLYVFYPKTGEPKVLPEVLTPDIVLSAISISKQQAQN